MATADHQDLRERGYVVLRGFFDARPLVGEVDRALREGVAPAHDGHRFPAVTVRYLPMMCERTPASLDLVRRLAQVAAEVLGRPVLPGRAKGSEYRGDTAWHRDSDHDLTSVGCVAYLESLSASTGALRVLPGSHRDRDSALPDRVARGGIAVETAPGDVIVLDERLAHASTGGRGRRQWRTDFVVDPAADGESAAVRRWFAQSLPDEAGDPGYDAEQYPSYGGYWRSSHPGWAARLVALGVIAP